LKKNIKTIFKDFLNHRICSVDIDKNSLNVSSSIKIKKDVEKKVKKDSEKYHFLKTPLLSESQHNYERDESNISPPIFIPLTFYDQPSPEYHNIIGTTPPLSHVPSFNIVNNQQLPQISPPIFLSSNISDEHKKSVELMSYHSVYSPNIDPKHGAMSPSLSLASFGSSTSTEISPKLLSIKLSESSQKQLNEVFYIVILFNKTFTIIVLIITF
jgi:hypothetical protein